MRQATRIALRRCHFGREDARPSVVLGQSHGLCYFEIRSWRRMNSLTAQRLLQRRFISSVAATASSGCHDTLRNAAHGATERLARIPHLLHQFGHLEEGGRDEEKISDLSRGLLLYPVETLSSTFIHQQWVLLLLLIMGRGREFIRQPQGLCFVCN